LCCNDGTNTLQNDNLAISPYRAQVNRKIEHGVPEGSILGHILFSLYMNDLPLSIIGSKIVLFADDTNILVSEENINNLQYKLNNVMNGLQT